MDRQERVRGVRARHLVPTPKLEIDFDARAKLEGRAGADKNGSLDASFVGHLLDPARVSMVHRARDSRMMIRRTRVVPEPHVRRGPSIDSIGTERHVDELNRPGARITRGELRRTHHAVVGRHLEALRVQLSTRNVASLRERPSSREPGAKHGTPRLCSEPCA